MFYSKFVKYATVRAVSSERNVPKKMKFFPVKFIEDR